MFEQQECNEVGNEAKVYLSAVILFWVLIHVVGISSCPSFSPSVVGTWKQRREPGFEVRLEDAPRSFIFTSSYAEFQPKSISQDTDCIFPGI